MCFLPRGTDRGGQAIEEIDVSMRFFSQFYRLGGRTERGASLVEYSLLIAMIALVCFGAVTYVGQALPGSMSTVGASLAA